MKRDKYISAALTEDEEQEVTKYIISQLMSGNNIKKSELVRNALLSYIRNGNAPVDNKQDSKPDDKPVQQQDSKQKKQAKVSITLDNGETLDF